MYAMFDSVDVGEIPRSANAVAGYVGGAWPTYAQLVRQFPRAHRLSIAVNASEDAECLDIEQGDATAAEAPAWFRRQKAHGTWKPCLYTSLSNVGALVATMKNAGIARSEYRLWTAHYTGVAHICSPADGCPVTADGTQWTDRALGRNLDESLLQASFWAAKNVPLYRNPEEYNWIREWDRIRTRKTPAAHVRRLFLKARMRRRMTKIKAVANAERPDGWRILNRQARYRALASRVGA